MRIAFLVLAHGATHELVEVVKRLVSAGDIAVIHYDLNSGTAPFERLQEALADTKGVMFASRIRCGWGEYSLVKGTLAMLETLEASQEKFDYAYLMSGADLPIRSLAALKEFLQKREGDEFIQSVPLRLGRWVKGGLSEERFLYRYPFNERTQTRRFYGYLRLQQRLRLRRRIPAGLDLSFGSQWWCMTQKSVMGILSLVRARPEVTEFFSTVWIPDESFFQTLVRSVAEESRITNLTLTLFEFSDYYKPIVFFNEHYSYLQRKPFFFARKFASSAHQIRQKLLDDFVSRDVGTLPDPARDTITHRPFVEPFRDRRAPRRYPGIMENEWYGELQFIRHPIYVFLSDFPLLDGLGNTLSKLLPDVSWTGRLFHPERVDLGFGRTALGGFSAGSVKERDRNAIAFLSAMSGACPQGLGFFLYGHDNDWVRSVILNLPQTRVVQWAKLPPSTDKTMEAVDIKHIYDRMCGTFGDSALSLLSSEDVVAAQIYNYLEDRSVGRMLEQSECHHLLPFTVWQSGKRDESALHLRQVRAAERAAMFADEREIMCNGLIAHIQQLAQSAVPKEVQDNMEKPISNVMRRLSMR